jgi:uncharacterized protein YdaU (DUF1376 family)
MWSYWVRGGLPDNDSALARIAGVDLTHWAEMRDSIQPLFGPGWVSPSLDAKIQEMISTSERRADAGRKGGKAAGHHPDYWAKAEAIMAERNKHLKLIK